jgi:hypothetical protein
MQAAVLSGIGDPLSEAGRTRPVVGPHEAPLPLLRGLDVRFVSGMEVPV